MHFFGVLIGFLLAVIWDKYKDWQRFKFTIRWVSDEVKESLGVKFNELPSEG